jgi:hypothetical protein
MVTMNQKLTDNALNFDKGISKFPRDTYDDPYDQTSVIRVAYADGDIISLPVKPTDEQQQGMYIKTDQGQIAFMGGYMLKKQNGSDESKLVFLDDYSAPEIKIGNDFLNLGTVTQVCYKAPKENFADQGVRESDINLFRDIKNEIRMQNLRAESDITMGRLPEHQASMIPHDKRYILATRNDGQRSMEEVLEYLNANGGTVYGGNIDTHGILFSAQELGRGDHHPDNIPINVNNMLSGYNHRASDGGEYTYVMVIPIDRNYLNEFYEKGVMGSGITAAEKDGAIPSDMKIPSDNKAWVFNKKYIAGVIDSYGKYIPFQSFML